MARVCVKRVCVLVLLAAVGVLPSPSLGHGRLRDPPSRSSMWRDGFSNPANYNDNGLNCGGFGNQWSVQGGKCGLCGDPYQGPRPNEPGPSNVYANGIISRTYTEGQVIEVKVEITAHHKGWFEFRICPHNDVTTPATQSCLDQYLLPLASQPGVTRYNLKAGTTAGWFTVRLRLPSGLVCDQCVFQWHYHAGNSWGCDVDGRCGTGFGPQEEFRGCADVKIVAGSGSGSKTAITASTSSSDATTTTTTTTTTTPTTTRSAGGGCRAAPGPYARVPGMDSWCRINCAVGFCPSSHCVCG